jgi:hypothetical protein
MKRKEKKKASLIFSKKKVLFYIQQPILGYFEKKKYSKQK